MSNARAALPCAALALPSRGAAHVQRKGSATVALPLRCPWPRGPLSLFLLLPVVGICLRVCFRRRVASALLLHRGAQCASTKDPRISTNDPRTFMGNPPTYIGHLIIANLVENLSDIHRMSIDVHRESNNIHQGSTNIHQGSTNIHRKSIIRSNVSDIYRTSIQNMYASKCIAGNFETKSILHGAGCVCVGANYQFRPTIAPNFLRPGKCGYE